MYVGFLYELGETNQGPQGPESNFFLRIIPKVSFIQRILCICKSMVSLQTYLELHRAMRGVILKPN